jgi:hypothetical protein
MPESNGSNPAFCANGASSGDATTKEAQSCEASGNPGKEISQS